MPDTPQINYITVIFMFLLFLFTVMFAMWTYRKIQETRIVIIKGQMKAMKILKQIEHGTYNEEDYLE